MTWQILEGDALERLRELPAGLAQTCITSPPYYGLRDYGDIGQLGLEPTPDLYVARLVDVFREVRRVLRDDGTLWLNLGDSYASGGSGGASPASTLTGGGGRYRDGSKAEAQHIDGFTRRAPDGYKPKDLLGIPWMVAFALRADGWYLRSDIILGSASPKGEVGNDGRALVRIEGEPNMREDVVRLSRSGTDLRYRPEFREWRTVLEVTYVTSALTRGSVLSLIDAGGMGVGVGEWRPEKDGDFGTYAIDQDRDIEVLG